MRIVVPALFASAFLGALGFGYTLLKTGVSIANYNIPSSSMAPTLVPGDYLFAAKGYYESHAPEIGDVVVHYRPDSDVAYVKRVVAGPGDRVRLENGRLYLNGQVVDRVPSDRPALPDFQRGNRYVETLPNGRSYEILESAGDTSAVDDFAEIVVEPGRYFLLGDNRDGSVDSRQPDHGTIPLELIVDRPSFIFLSQHFARIGTDLQPEAAVDP